MFGDQTLLRIENQSHDCSLGYVSGGSNHLGRWLRFFFGTAILATSPHSSQLKVQP
jgi:hypothetical protein